MLLACATAPPSELRAGPAPEDETIRLAEQAPDRGDAAAARHELMRALEAAPWSPRGHDRLAGLTGKAPRARLSGQAAVDTAAAHPYDPWALLAAGRALARAGDRDGAVDALVRAVWLGDVDPKSSAAAADLLVAMPEGWFGQIVVPVHLYADAPLRASDGWRFQLRTALHSASNGLAPLLDVRFRPVAIRPFESGAESSDLASIHGAFTTATADPPGPGILAAFTGRAPPAVSDAPHEGIAEFLGRRLTVRLAPREVESRALAHEILHLYGAIHVTGEIDSLMNPDGASRTLDARSHATVRSLRGRRFDGRGIERDVLAHVDLARVNDAYADVLGANIAFREAGIADALARGNAAGSDSAARLRRIRQEDPHLADVAAVVASLMLAERRTDDAVLLLETAANLYGRTTPRGRQSAALAEELRRAAPQRRRP